MPPPKPDAARARALELAKKMGVRGVAAQLAREGFAVGKSAVAEWIRSDRARRAGAAEAGVRSNGTQAPPRASVLPPPKRARRAALAEGDEDDDGPPSSELSEEGLRNIDPDALDFAELERVDAQVGRFMREAYRDREERRYAVLARLKLEVRAAMHKVRPMPKVDPLVDPASLEARRAVLARLGKMMENARAAAAARAAGEGLPPP